MAADISVLAKPCASSEHWGTLERHVPYVRETCIREVVADRPFTFASQHQFKESIKLNLEITQKVAWNNMCASVSRKETGSHIEIALALARVAPLVKHCARFSRADDARSIAVLLENCLAAQTILNYFAS